MDIKVRNILRKASALNARLGKAAIGAVLGAGAGAIAGNDESKLKTGLIGAVAGGLLGGGIGGAQAHHRLNQAYVKGATKVANKIGDVSPAIYRQKKLAKYISKAGRHRNRAMMNIGAGTLGAIGLNSYAEEKGYYDRRSKLERMISNIFG